MMEIAGLTRKRELAKLLEISPQSINAYKPGQDADRDPEIPSDWVVKFLLKTETSLSDLLGMGKKGENLMSDGNDMPSSKGKSEQKEGIERRGVDVRIPWLRREFGMSSEEIMGVLVELATQWTTGSLGAAMMCLTAWVMDADNMEPTIQRNSLVLIDKRFESIQGAGVYAFMAKSMLIIRRVYINFDGLLEIGSDNPKYADHKRFTTDSPGEPGGLGATKVIGRVIMVANKI